VRRVVNYIFLVFTCFYTVIDRLKQYLQQQRVFTYRVTLLPCSNLHCVLCSRGHPPRAVTVSSTVHVFFYMIAFEGLARSVVCRCINLNVAFTRFLVIFFVVFQYTRVVFFLPLKA
jgi:hypothetical protein